MSIRFSVSTLFRPHMVGKKCRLGNRGKLNLRSCSRGFFATRNHQLMPSCYLAERMVCLLTNCETPLVLVRMFGGLHLLKMKICILILSWLLLKRKRKMPVSVSAKVDMRALVCVYNQLRKWGCNCMLGRFVEFPNTGLAKMLCNALLMPVALKPPSSVHLRVVRDHG